MYSVLSAYQAGEVGALQGAAGTNRPPDHPWPAEVDLFAYVGAAPPLELLLSWRDHPSSPVQTCACDRETDKQQMLFGGPFVT